MAGMTVPMKMLPSAPTMSQVCLRSAASRSPRIVRTESPHALPICGPFYHDAVKLLAISGSLRTASSNTALLEAARDLAPPGLEIELWRGMAGLPHFNPDHDTGDVDLLPLAVRELRRSVGMADGLVISTPEYAHGLPGSFKNVLDWLVGSTEFPGKTVAVLNPSSRAVHALEQLLLVLATMSARLTDPPSFTIQLPRRDMTARDIADDPALASALRSALSAIQTIVAATNA